MEPEIFMPKAAAQTGFASAEFKKFRLAAGLVTLAFAIPLWRLFRDALSDDLYSFIPLMPFISGYLAWTLKSKLPSSSPPARPLGIMFFVAGAAAAIGYLILARTATPDTIWNSLALAPLAWLLCLAGAGCFTLGGAIMRELIFPFCLLLFMIPFPVPVRNALEYALQHGSADVAEWFFAIAGTPYLRIDTYFHLPNMNLQVAPECSGIHSTWVLLITSLVAGHMILRRPWKRAVLCLFVIPLAYARNGFRVFVIGELCVHISPKMIDSPIHHHGGPLFFVLSLIPFFILLYFLRKGESPSTTAPK